MLVFFKVIHRAILAVENCGQNNLSVRVVRKGILSKSRLYIYAEYAYTPLKLAKCG